MYLVLQEYDGNVRVIHNGYTESEVQFYMNKIMSINIESFKQCPLQKNVENVTYTVVKNNNKWTLVSHSSIIKKGYLYNKKTIVDSIVFTLFYSKNYVREPSVKACENKVSNNIILKPCRLYEFSSNSPNVIYYQ